MHKPGRRVVTPSKGRVVGRFFSSRNRRSVPWESQLERDCMRILDVLPEVEAYWSQPGGFIYEFAGKQRIYYPDIEVKTRTGRKFIEVKPNDKLLKGDLNKPIRLWERRIEWARMDRQNVAESDEYCFKGNF